MDTQFYIPNDLLVKVDILSMAHALEVRSPFLDHSLMEFVSQLPPQMKLKWGKLKYLVKKAFQKEIPVENLRHRKMGFAIPLAQWIRGHMQETFKEGLLSEQTRIHQYFLADEIHRLFSEHVTGKKDYAHELWALLVLEYWHREFIG